MMTEQEFLIQLRALATKLEAHQQLIAQLLAHDNPDIVLLGRSQKTFVDECQMLLNSLIVAAQNVRASTSAQRAVDAK